MACIVFNILILTLRSISIFYEYIRTRSKLVDEISCLRLEADNI
jgi:hypothetical protein